LFGSKIKEAEMRKTSSAHGETENAYKISVGKPEVKRVHAEYQAFKRGKC
jgi:hypothetical protein